MKYKFTKNAFGYKADNEVELTADEAKAFGDAVSEVKVTAEDVASKAADELMASVDAKIESAVSAKVASALAKAAKRPTIHVGPDNVTLDPKRGFKSFGHFAKAVMNNDEILRKTGMDETTSADGGYVVPVEYATQIFALIMSEQALLPKTRNFTTNTLTFKHPIDNLVTLGTNPIGGSWVSEGTAPSVAGSGAFNQLSFSLNKYGVLVGVTDELLTDNNVLLEQFLVAKAGYAITYACNQAILQGTGSGQPTGIIGNAATVAVTANGSDEYVSGPDFVYKDLSAMMAVWQRSMNPSPAWIVNKALMNNVYNLKDDSGRNLYYAPGTLAQQPYGMLMGIPVIESFHCATPGAPGDIILADLGAYITVTKDTGIEAATSIHLWFDQDKTAFRFTFRIDGKPGLAQPLKDPNFATNGIKYSPFVVLSQRT